MNSAACDFLFMQYTAEDHYYSSAPKSSAEKEVYIAHTIVKTRERVISSHIEREKYFTILC